MIEIIDEYGSDKMAAILSAAAQAALEYAGALGASVEILLIGDERVRQLNAAKRHIDAATDVLSFPMLEYERPLISGGVHVSDRPSAFLGSIAVSLDRLAAQAEEYGHSPEREAAFLATHGMLHLLGYDHERPEDEAMMRGAQEKILSARGWTRD